MKRLRCMLFAASIPNSVFTSTESKSTAKVGRLKGTLQGTDDNGAS